MTVCPNCRTDLSYVVDGRTRSLVIGVRIRDDVLYWQCPTCGYQWHRFPPGHPLRSAAEAFVNSRPA